MPLPLPTFDGQEIFGYWFTTLKTRPHPARIQWNSYAGVNGREALICGSDGYVTEGEFLMIAPDLPTLATQEQVWWNYLAAGVATVLFDSLGTTWINVILTEFEPLDGPIPTWDDLANNWGVSRRYKATFEHTGA
jgi:hypothetical protein